MGRRLPGLVAAAITAILVLTLAPGSTVAAAPPPASVAADTVVAGDALSPWRRCDDLRGMQCADLTVPLDYARPSGPTITIAVSRIVATRTPSKGVMLVNPGGPGAPGRELASLGRSVPRGVGGHYTWIGFDPRGVGASRPALRCDRSYFDPGRPAYVPRTKKQVRAWRQRARQYAASCATGPGAALLPHLNTRTVVRDLEQLRIALGTPTIGFYGFSYGSLLGQAYATAHPDRVSRMILDGVVDPATYWYRSNLQQNRWFDRNMNRFFRWVARHDRYYRLGTKWRPIRRAYYRQLDVLRKKPAAQGRLGPAEFNDVMLNAGYYVFDWPSLAQGFAALVKRGNGNRLFATYRDQEMGDDNSYAVYLAVQCTDQRAPAWKKQKKDARRIHRNRPFLAWNNTWYNAPCLTWPAAAVGRPSIDGTALAAQGTKILLISETRDAATPFKGAVKVRRMFPSASLIAGKNGTTHSGSLSGVTCVDNAIAAYLATGTVPRRRPKKRFDLRCPAADPFGPADFRAAR